MYIKSICISVDWWSTNASRRWKKSLGPYEKALTLYKQLYGQEHPCSEIAECYLGLGSVYLHRRNFWPAIGNYRKALDIQDKILPRFHPALAFCHNKLAYSFFRVNNMESATTHFEEALDTGLKSLQPAHPLIIELYYILGVIHRNANTQQAEEYFRKQLQLLEQHRTKSESASNTVEIGD